MSSTRKIDKFSGLLSILAVLGVWEFVSRAELVNAIFLPPPTAILKDLYHLLSTIGIYVDLFATSYRFAVGYLLGCSIAIPIGLIMGTSNSAYLALEPLAESLRPIPASALIPVALLLFGLGDGMTIIIVAYAAVWPVLINTIDGVRGVDPTLVDTGLIFGLDSKRLLRKVIIPASLPNIVTGMRISLSLSVVLVVVVEMLVGDRGLGQRVINAERSFRFNEMYGVIFIIGLMGYLVNKAFLALRNRLLEWHVESKELRQ
jgi:ABC-type nitrate/sulfonate/bicarbonate transport system permease component